MLNIHKDKILDFAEKYNVPYFKDTTPDWSLRGIFRRQILPLLKNTYSNNITKNLFNISEQSDEWNSLIQEKIIQPFMEDIHINNKIVMFNIKEHVNSPNCFWKVVFMRIFYIYNFANPTRKSIDNFIKIIKSNKIIKIQNNEYIRIGLSRHCYATIDRSYKIIMTFN